MNAPLRILATVVLALSFELGCGYLGGHPDAGAAGAIAQLETKKGTVTLERAGKTTPAELGYLFARDSIETGSDGEARIRFPGGRVIDLGHDARFSLGEDQGGLVLDLSRGLILSQVEAGGEGALRGLSIQTPFGTTRLGTDPNETSIEVGKDGARVDVRLGQVEFRSTTGEVGKAGAGEKLLLTMGKVELGGPKPETMELHPMQIVVSATTGRAEIKRKDAKGWVAVTKKGEAIGAGDALRVKSGQSLLQLEGSDSHLQAESGSELQLQETNRQGQVDTSKLDLRKGALALALAENRTTRLLVGNLELSAAKGGQFTLAKTQDGYEVSATAGDLSVKKEGVEKTVRAGEVARIGKKGTEVREQAAAELILPSRSGTRVYHPVSEEMTLSWPGAKDADYHVDVATDPAFSQKIASGIVHQSAVTVTAPARGSMYWRVEDAQGKQVDRGSAVFAPEKPVGDLANPRNEVPEGTEKTTIFFQDKPPAVTFLFKPQPSAAKYRLQVYQASALDKPVIDKTFGGEKGPLEAGSLSEGNYVWSDTPLGPTGEELRGGKMSKLELVYDNSVPSILIKQPRNGDPYKPKVQASGVAPVGSKVIINGKAAPLDDKHRFDLSVSPVGRPPMVVFRLSQPSQVDVYTVRVLRRGGK